MYVKKQIRIANVVRTLMKLTKKRWRDLYVPVSAFLKSRGVMKTGKGVRFGTKAFKWKQKHCDACLTKFQPTANGQRFCSQCGDQNRNLPVVYGITHTDYDMLLQQRQKGCCAICKVDFSIIHSKKIHIDHCHYTGVIRGILCNKCNTRLASLDDDNWLRHAQEYLSKPGITPRCECMITRKLLSKS